MSGGNLVIDGIYYRNSSHGGNEMVVKWDGRDMTLKEFADYLGLSKPTVYDRLKRFQSVEAAVNPPWKKRLPEETVRPQSNFKHARWV